MATHRSKASYKRAAKKAARTRRLNRPWGKRKHYGLLAHARLARLRAHYAHKRHRGEPRKQARKALAVARRAVTLAKKHRHHVSAKRRALGLRLWRTKTAAEKARILAILAKGRAKRKR